MSDYKEFLFREREIDGDSAGTEWPRVKAKEIRVLVSNSLTVCCGVR